MFNTLAIREIHMKTSRLLLRAYQNGQNKQTNKLAIPNTGKGTEKTGHSYIVGGNVKQCKYWKWFSSFLKN